MSRIQITASAKINKMTFCVPLFLELKEDKVTDKKTLVAVYTSEDSYFDEDDELDNNDIVYFEGKINRLADFTSSLKIDGLIDLIDYTVAGL